MSRFTTAVVDHIESDFALFVVDLVHRQDLGAVGNGGVQAGLDALVEKHRVEYLAGRRVQTEGDVGQAERGVHVRVATLKFADGFDGFDAVAASFLLASGNRESQTVDNNVLLAQSPRAGDVGDETLGDLNLLVLCTRLTFFVDSQSDHGSTVLNNLAHNALVARVRAIAVFKVHRVDRAATTEVLQASLQNLRFRGVQHDRQRHRGGDLRCQGCHVIATVAPHVVHTQVNHVCAIGDLTAGGVKALLPIAGQHGLAESLGTVGVGALTNHGDAGCLRQRSCRVQRSDLIDWLCVRIRRWACCLNSRALLSVGACTGNSIANSGNMLRCGTTAATDHRQAKLFNKAAQRCG